MDRRRRRLLKVLGTGSVVTLAGCSSNSEDDDVNDDEPATDRSSRDESGDPARSATPKRAPSSTLSPGETPTATPEISTPTSYTVGPATEQASKLAADDGEPSDQFGSSVAVSGDGSTAIIGARWDEGPNDEGPNDEGVGSAYVFTKVRGIWSQQAKLAADDGDEDDYFGSSVAVSRDGSTAIIGATGDSGGSAYVFTRAGNTWTQQAKLAAKDGGGNAFGASVAVSDGGETAVIGDFKYNNETGSAYAFTRTGGSWIQQAKLVDPNGWAGDNFGSSVAVSGDGSTAVIGAQTYWTSDGHYPGGAYIFSRSGGTWRQQTRIVPSDGKDNDTFGASVAMSRDGSTTVIGSPGDDDPSDDGTSVGDAGSAYVFSRTSSGWRRQVKLAADDGDENDFFGTSVAISGDGSTAIISAPSDTDPNGNRAGSAYVFSRTSRSWRQQAKLAADDGDSNDYFGWSVAVSGAGSTAIISAYWDENPNGRHAGSAYVFE